MGTGEGKGDRPLCCLPRRDLLRPWAACAVQRGPGPRPGAGGKGSPWPCLHTPEVEPWGTPGRGRLVEQVWAQLPDSCLFRDLVDFLEYYFSICRMLLGRFSETLNVVVLSNVHQLKCSFAGERARCTFCVIPEVPPCF